MAKDRPPRVKPITLLEMQQMFFDANARLDRTIGVPDALGSFIHDENPRNSEDDQEESPPDDQPSDKPRPPR